jgi:transposase InsO family protein
MDQRRRFVLQVERGASLSQACREFGISRVTGRKWLGRAQEVGIANMRESSRAPRNVANRTPLDIEQALLECREKYAEEWGAKKLVPLLKKDTGIEIPLRTADRILKRYGCVKPRSVEAAPIRFERKESNHLLQMDFKGIPKSLPYSPLTILDDAHRFCLRFVPVADRTTETVFSVLWEMFADYGLPLQMLCDNGDCWGAGGHRRPTPLEAKLMLLGIGMTHGRICHPQTQGKVERFHGTVKSELGPKLLQPTLKEAEVVYKEFVDRYNWVRPHEAIGFDTPGARFQPSPRKRPDSLPEHYIPEGSLYRKVDASGSFWFKGQRYRTGRGLTGQYVIIQDDDLGQRIYFAGFPIAYLWECL